MERLKIHERNWRECLWTSFEEGKLVQVCAFLRVGTGLERIIFSRRVNWLVHAHGRRYLISPMA